MTLKELSQLYYLNAEIERDRKRLESLRARISGIASPDWSGMPRSMNGHRIERYIAEIVDLEAIISAKLQQGLHERSRLERYIADIPDSLTRQIFLLRFVDGLNWVRAAAGVGGGMTDVAARQRVHRYLKSSKKS